MLVRNWVTECIGAGYINFERLNRDLLARAADAGLDVSTGEIRVIVEKLIADGRIETCQFLAEDQRYAPTIYDNSNIYWYWFRLKGATVTLNGRDNP